MAGRYLLDTSIVVELFGRHPGVAARLETTDELYLSVVTLGELHYGAAYSAQPQANTARIALFAATCTTVGIDAATAIQFGTLKANLRRAGKLIPENDIWIAASALRHDLVLVARDAHFAAVEGLVREEW
jgi:tRNA(fMet)-specific endonuclease VapC